MKNKKHEGSRFWLGIIICDLLLLMGYSIGIPRIIFYVITISFMVKIVCVLERIDKQVGNIGIK